MTSRGRAVRIRGDVPEFDPFAHGWTGTDDGLGHANDEGTLTAASWSYARAAVPASSRADLANEAVRAYRRGVLGMSPRETVAARRALNRRTSAARAVAKHVPSRSRLRA